VKSPLHEGAWLELEEVGSTQTAAAELLARGDPVGVVFAHSQTLGKGRFGRTWHSQPGDSLTMSLVFRGYADHPAPQFIGMAVACAAAAAVKCELQWPNDLVFGSKKVGGILTEILPDEGGRRVPVVGIGINLNQSSFPVEIADRAVSIAQHRGGSYEAGAIAKSILDRLPLMPEADSWDTIQPVWTLFDHTPGKSYLLADGVKGVALGVGPDGSLMCMAEGQIRSVLAAEAIFGTQTAS
jgi:BirA family transcriptional regulator, biotin operon repressor / biotin---[acetyl-CoA-carboxylase] ligase